MLEDQGTSINNYNSDAWKKYRELYREKVKLYDDEVGQVLGGMKKQELDDDALIVATSDYGDMDGQHCMMLIEKEK